jgi:hypothetical protein
VVKYLRRSQGGGSRIIDEQAQDLLDELRATDTQAPDGEAITKAVLRKIDILQSRDKKIRLLRSLVRLSHPWVCSVLLELLANPSEEVRDLAVRELAGRDDCPVLRIYQKLTQPPWYVKSAILRILGIRKNPEAVKHIRGVIDDANVEVKRSAAQALGEIGGKDARTLLVRLTKDENPHVRSAAAEALDKICDFRFI